MELKDSIVRLPFVGPIYAKRLEKLGILTIEDLLFHFPFRYDDFSKISSIAELQAGETATITATVEKMTNAFTKNGKRLQQAEIFDKSGKIEAVWFNQMYLLRTFRKGETYNFSGKVAWFGRKKVFVSPDYEKTSLKCIHTARLVPVYNETYGISSKWLRSRINFALKNFNDQVKEFLPDEVIKKNNLITEKEALDQIHFPRDMDFAQKAKYRLSFDELYLIQLSSLLRKKDWQKKVLGKQFFIDFEKSMKFIDSLPFSLTNAQKRCSKEILIDLQKSTPMNRLLQGDVGSGKTVVAALAAYTAYLNKTDTLFMAPTEILANQHLVTLKSFLEPLGVPVELITGSNKPKTRNSSPKVVIGTHALLYQNFKTEDVGLVIVDEQHRFGVEQRTLLSQKGRTPHFLTMTATPIPRTIALTMYNDLDLSVMDEMPEGRIKVKSWVVPKEKRAKAYGWIKTKVKQTPQQAFIICPFIEQSETKSTIKAAIKEFETLSKDVFPDLKLGLLHGRMKSKEKDSVLTSFKEGRLDILVATPVVEVGIDIPNATIMMIEAADHFGLAQLHQLRGRVGRNSLQAYCLLFADNDSPLSINRLKNLETISNGMQLAEVDLKLRGPGQIFGTAQHGFTDLHIASFSNLDLIQKTRLAAEASLNNISPHLKDKLEKYKIAAISN